MSQRQVLHGFVSGRSLRSLNARCAGLACDEAMPLRCSL